MIYKDTNIVKGRFPMKKTILLLMILLTACATKPAVEYTGEFTVTEIFLVDDFEDGNSTSSNGGYNYTFCDSRSSINHIYNFSPGAEGSVFCTMAEYTLRPVGDQPYFAGITLVPMSNAGYVDVTGYMGLCFFARGSGYFTAALATEPARYTNNHYQSGTMILKEEWTLYEIPFDQLSIPWGEPYAWDPATVFEVGFGLIATNASREGEIYIDNVGFYKAVPEVREKKDKEPKAVPVKQKDLDDFKGRSVAIVGFESEISDDSVSTSLMEFISNAFVNLDIMKVMDRSNINKILTEQKFQTSDFADRNKIITIGKLAGAEYIVTGHLSRLKDDYYLSIKLISVETSEIIGSSIVKAKDEEDFFAECNTAVRMLFE